jgi:hypothetical protein
METIVKCPRCDATYPVKKTRCPSCGWTNPSLLIPPQLLKTFGIIGIIGGVALIVMFFFMGKTGRDIVAVLPFVLALCYPVTILLSVGRLALVKGRRDSLWSILSIILTPLITIPLLLILPPKPQYGKFPWGGWRWVIRPMIMFIILISFWIGLALLLGIFSKGSI